MRNWSGRWDSNPRESPYPGCQINDLPAMVSLRVIGV